LPDAGSRPDPAAVQAQSDGNTRQFQRFDTEHQIATCRWRDSRRDRSNNKTRQQIKVLPDSAGALIHPRSVAVGAVRKALFSHLINDIVRSGLGDALRRRGYKNGSWLDLGGL
jgi:hypothetical protein